MKFDLERLGRTNVYNHGENESLKWVKCEITLVYN